MMPLNYTLASRTSESTSMRAVQTVEDKTRALQSRKREQRELGARIDRVIASSQDAELVEAVGCGGALCHRVARTLGVRTRTPGGLQTATELKGAVVQDKAHAGIFGVQKQKQSAASKLEAAAEALRKRVAVLEARSLQHMEAVRESLRANKKELAARELKKAKMCNRQAASSQAVLDAMEAQTDMMEQNALQQEVARALAGTAKTMKRDKKLLGKAEDAVDSAAEMRDLHDELNQIMAGLGEQTADFDEDDLQAELDAMLESGETPAAAPVDAAVAKEMAKAAEALDTRHEEYAEAQRLRATMPKAPAGRRLEKESLLSAA